MKSIYLIILLDISLAAYCLPPANALIEGPQTKSGKVSVTQPKTFFVDHIWRFSYSFPAPPSGAPSVTGSFRFVLNGSQIEGYEEDARGPRLVLRSVLDDASNDIHWQINFGVLDSQNGSSAGQGSAWDCAKQTRFGQWIPISLLLSSDKQTISFQYPILEVGFETDKVGHCREVAVFYRITQKHQFL